MKRFIATYRVCCVVWCGVGSGNAIPNLQFNILQTCFEFIFELFFDAHSSCNGITLTHNNISQIPFKWLETCLEHLTKFCEWSFQRKCVRKIMADNWWNGTQNDALLSTFWHYFKLSRYLNCSIAHFNFRKHLCLNHFV